MAGRIKGITVEIGGDTTGLEKALKNVNSTIKNTQSQLKDVNRLLPLELVKILLPGNARLRLFAILVVVVTFLGPDIQNHADRQEIQIRHGQADFEAAQEEKRSGYLTGAGLPFFLDWISVTRFVPQRSRISGSTW